MYNAKIINNIPICGKCGSSNVFGLKNEYKEVENNGDKYVMFQTKCHDCNQYNCYLADVDLETNTRYEIKGKVTEVKD